MSYYIGKDNLLPLEKILLNEKYSKIELGNKTGYCYQSPKGGKVNAYKTGNIIIQAKKGEYEEIETVFLEKCGHLIFDEELNKNLNLNFKVANDKILYIQQIIDRYIAASLSEKTNGYDKNAYYRYKITDKVGNEVTVTQYKTNTLLIQGSRSSLWENLSESIGAELNLNFNTVVAKVIAEPGKPVEVLSVITNDIQEKATETIKQRLEDCYMFLYDPDKALIESSQCLIDGRIPLKDYYAYVSGTIKSIEGFIKKVLIKINTFTEAIVRSPEFNFGLVIDLNSKQLTPQVAKCLPKEKNQFVFDLVKIGIYDYRHPFMHSGPPPIKQYKSFGDAESAHNELLGLMKKTYKQLKSELEK